MEGKTLLAFTFESVVALRPMKSVFKYLISVLAIAQLIGCASRPIPVAGDSITVNGFVKHRGQYAYVDGMTVAEALRDAGGYGYCSSCQQFYDKYGWHPTFDHPPKVKRGREILELPVSKIEWMKFKLQRNDEIKFQHFLF